MTLDTREQRALAKAREQWGVGNRPMRLEEGVYVVRSRGLSNACPHCGAVLPRTPDVYVVTLAAHGLVCDCPTGLGGGVCWHKAAVRHARRVHDYAPEDAPP